MKKHIFKFIAILLICAGVFSACKEECINSTRENIFGQWKLLEVSISVNYSQLDTTDYSEENIIFDFQENNKLVITGNIVDSLSLFNDFQKGVHFYEYFTFDCHSDPGLNLLIDNPNPGMSWEKSYLCRALLSEETMMISKMDWMGKEGDDSAWNFTFIKLNK